MLQRTESSGSFHLLLSSCFTFLVDNQELMRQTKKETVCTGFVCYLYRGQSGLMCAVSIPALWAMAQVLHSATGVSLLLENKSKQLPLVQEGNTIRFSHPWKAFCLWVWMHGRMHFNHWKVQCHSGERMGNRKIKQISIIHPGCLLHRLSLQEWPIVWKQSSV